MADHAYEQVRRLSRRRFLATSAIAGAGVVGGSALISACAGGSSAGPAGSGDASAAGGKPTGSMTWGAWANPGEAERFKAYTENWNQKTGVNAKFQVVVGDYLAKLLTQLAGGAAPDAFYAGDDQLAKLIETKNVLALDDFLGSDAATVKFTDHYKGLTKWMKGPDGKIYGLPNDCNPIALWFNQNVLDKAGVESPAAQQEAGTWNLDAMTHLLTKVKATGMPGNVIESGWWGFWMGWMSAQGGTPFDEDGKAVFDTDPKSLAALTWVIEQLQSGNMHFGGSLPKGQGVDAMFYAGQLATMSYGRWVLPNLKKVASKVAYDLAPLPSEDGKSIPSVPVGTSSIAVNAKAKNPTAALAFVSDYTNADGQRFRLSGGGNALPTLPGLEDIAIEGNDPKHGGWFNDLAKAGWGTPKAIYSNPTVGAQLPLLVNKLLLPDSLKTITAQSFAQQVCQLLNSGS
jgi:multiple sugar transport system substrate-binding protein